MSCNGNKTLCGCVVKCFLLVWLLLCKTLGRSDYWDCLAFLLPQIPGAIGIRSREEGRKEGRSDRDVFEL